MGRVVLRVGLAAIALAAPRVARAEDPAARAVPAMRVFDDKEGLPQNTAAALAFDRDGRLWVGTQEGLAAYDGGAFRRVVLPESAKSAWITALATLPSGAIEAATHADGVWTIDGARFEHATRKDGLPDDTVLALATDARGIVWAGTREGLAWKDGARWAPVTGAPVGAEHVSALAAGDDGSVWVGTEHAVARFDGRAWTKWATGDAGLPAAAVRALHVPKGDAAHPWAAMQQAGIARFDGARWNLTTGLPCDDVASIVDVGASTWIGSDCGGLVRDAAGARLVLDKKTSALPSDLVLALLPTRAEQGPPSLWVGTDGGGVARVALAGWRAIGAKTSAVDAPVYAFAWSRDEGGDAAWIGTQNGLLRWDGAAWKPVAIPGLASGEEYTNAVLEARGEQERGVWVATFGGVSRLHDGAWTTYREADGLPAKIALTLFEARDPKTRRPELLVGLRNGLARWDGAKWAAVDEPGAPSKSEVTSMTESTGDGDAPVLWVATTDAGLFRRDARGWTNLSTKSSPLPADEVLQVRRVGAPGGGDRIVVSFGEAGLAWFDARDPSRWSRLSTRTEPALPDDCVYGVVEDKGGRVYACTNHGVARLTPKDGAYDVLTFGRDDGLPSEECDTGALAIDPRGRVWAGTVGGAAVFDPAEPFDDRAPKKLLLTSARLFESPIDLATKSDLSYEESTLSFAFALLSFHREADTRFRTQLVGLERDPSPWTADAKVRYTSLPAGSYELRAWGRDWAGNVSAPLVIPFHVRPAPWRTWWAYLAYVALGASIVASSVRAREAALKRRARELEDKVEVRTRELAKTVRELDKKNAALLESHQRANRIFSAFADVLPGSVLDGKYRIEEKIGAGGFGAVFRAEQTSLGRKVAVKVFRPSSGNDSAAALDRFQREGMSACRVNHPNAIQVFDSGISGDGIAYLVMELLDGHALRVELASGALPLDRALWIAGAIAGALAAAHEAGIIHRDVKPDNVFLQQAKDGEIPKLLDFGIAKLQSGDDASDAASTPGAARSAPLTASAALVGTPRYMAPERLSHEKGDDDARSDVYSVGVLLYEAIAGRSPWPRSDDLFALITKIIAGDAIPLADLDVPARVASLVARAMARDPAERPSAAELARALDDARKALTDDERDRIYGRVAEPLTSPAAETREGPIGASDVTSDTKSMGEWKKASGNPG